MKNEIVVFSDNGLSIEVQISPDQETVWLTQKQMEDLFEVSHATISEHISNILADGELDETSVGFSDKSTGGRKPRIYDLDMIISVGYRVNSKRGIVFRRWASRILKDYMLKGYAVNEKRLEALNKNKALYKEGKQVISNSALVAITLMVAESRPEEKDIMVTLIMNFLK